MTYCFVIFAVMVRSFRRYKVFRRTLNLQQVQQESQDLADNQVQHSC